MSKIILGLILTVGFISFKAQAQQNSSTAELKTTKETALKNQKNAENNRKIQLALEEGNKAYNEKNYKLAAEKYDEGYNLDPEFAGSAPVFLNNKASALRQLGAQIFNDAAGKKTNPSIEANQLLLDSIDAYKTAKRILEAAPVPDDEDRKKVLEINKRQTSTGLLESYRVLGSIDETRIPEVIAVIEDSIKIESDDDYKQKARETIKRLKENNNIDY